MSGLCGITAIVLFIFLEETNFKCDTPYNAAEPPVQAVADVPTDEDVKDFKQHERQEPIAIDVLPPRVISKWPGPKPWRFGKRSPHAWGIMWRGFVQPLALMPSPLVFWCGVMYGIYQVYFNREPPPPTR